MSSALLPSLFTGTFVLDIFSQKVLNSGKSVKTKRGIFVNGLKEEIGQKHGAEDPLHRSTAQCAKSRRTKKLLAKSQ